MTILEDLDHADNIGLLSSEHQDAQQNTKHLRKIATIGIKVNSKKTQVLRMITRVNNPVMIDGKHIEDVEEFNYLATKVTTGDCNQEINTNISTANQTFAMLKSVDRATNLSVHTNIKIFRSSVLSILLYVAECWKTTVTIQQRLEVFHIKCLQHILKIYWPNTISNEELGNRTGMDTLTEIIQTWLWLGLVCHMPSNSITRTALR